MAFVRTRNLIDDKGADAVVAAAEKAANAMARRPTRTRPRALAHGLGRCFSEVRFIPGPLWVMGRRRSPRM
jgi:predicted neutral ceramidase superfamily lipid hydrolase